MLKEGFLGSCTCGNFSHPVGGCKKFPSVYKNKVGGGINSFILPQRRAGNRFWTCNIPIL